MTSPSSFYEEKITTYSKQLDILKKELSLVSLLRLISFSGFAVVGYFLAQNRNVPLLLGDLLLLAVYVILVFRSQHIKNRSARCEKLLFINTNELGIINGQTNRLSDGKDFLRNESYLDDLDIFGKKSLYHQLNRTTGSYGAEALAALLKQPLLSADAIGEQQEAIRVLATQPDQRQLIIAYGLMGDEKAGQLHHLMNWLQTAIGLFQKRWVMSFLWVIVIYNSAALIYWILAGDFRPLLAGVALAWILNGIHARFYSQEFDIGKKRAVLDQYATTLRLFNNMDGGRSPLLFRLQQQTMLADRAIQKLARLSDYLDRQANPFVAAALNSLFVYNLRGQVSLERWKEVNKTQLPAWIDAVGRIECLNSLAGFAFNNPDYIYPTPIASGPATRSQPIPEERSPLMIEALQLAHPLLPAKARVANDLSLGRTDRIMLVTGSNMSGKTTFLRTVGVNLLLAQCGAPVCAVSFSFTPMQILSSLRISDSLQENTSYFMAELKKLQTIIHSLQTGRPALVLIDEILRGTNSEDKTYGSEQFIRKLLQNPCLSLFATHDLSLGKLEDEDAGRISNYCFESIIEKGELLFDYRLQRGIARNRNASFLMKKMEII